jgi:hypothetical protein
VLVLLSTSCSSIIFCNREFPEVLYMNYLFYIRSLIIISGFAGPSSSVQDQSWSSLPGPSSVSGVSFGQRYKQGSKFGSDYLDENDTTGKIIRLTNFTYVNINDFIFSFLNT